MKAQKQIPHLCDPCVMNIVCQFLHSCVIVSPSLERMSNAFKVYRLVVLLKLTVAIMCYVDQFI